MAQYEIVLPETKPETEWVRLQGALTMRLDRWATGRGEVGPEWRFRVAPRGEVRRPLVPDVAYVSNERLRTLSDTELEVPPLAPDVAVEILSPDDRRADVDDKIDVYLRAGSSLVIVVDPQQRAVELHDRDATGRLDETGAIEHWALPEFSYPVSELFAVLRRSR
jgi:Uma2 family endonuclease